MDFRRRAIIVCESVHHGNTRRIADAIAKVLHAKVLTPAELTTPANLAQYDLVGFGSGIYFGRPHRALRRLVDQLVELPTDVFLFSTSGLPGLSRLWYFGLRKKLARKGARVLGEFACRGWDTVGPLVLIGGVNRRHPNEFDVARAEAFARELSCREQFEGIAVEDSSPDRR